MAPTDPALERTQGSGGHSAAGSGTRGSGASAPARGSGEGPAEAPQQSAADDGGERRVEFRPSWAGRSVRSSAGSAAHSALGLPDPERPRGAAASGAAAQHQQEQQVPPVPLPELTQEDLEFLKMRCLFDDKQIRRLWAQFAALDADGDGVLSGAELGRLTEFRYHPLRQRVVDVLGSHAGSDGDAEGGGGFRFAEFLAALSPFAPTAPKEDKARLAFRLWDCDGDGVLSRADVSATLRLMVQKEGLDQGQLQQQGWLTDQQLGEVVRRAFDELREGPSAPEAISFDAFNRVTFFADLHFRLTFQDL
eukprot:TRINITY_DN27707_c0_g1_i1.p2 TRINITY_DN27707_c0_g1~~TRINITY_DN27707_c0_g1_i1.p2  ORF type:complete len:307 (+),score=117.84 TRINITY_DN27707_c0_g1_i1:65-985(+)